MKSSFFEFRVATSGLQVARTGLNVVSHNVANAENKGYSRQYIEQRAGDPLTYYNGRGMYGSGADVYGIGQHRSLYLDKKYWQESSIQGEYTVKNSQLSLVETILNGTATTGLNSLFDSFFKSLQDLTQNSGDSTYRTNVITTAETMAAQVNYTYESFRRQQQDINTEVSTMVQVINSLGSQVASLNRQIKIYEQDGSRANDLRDERTRLVDKLSGYVNITVREDELNEDYEAGMYPEPEDRYRSNKKYSILIDGEEFVTDDMFMGIEVEERPVPLHEMDAPGLYDVYFSRSGKKMNLFSPSMSGQLKGLIDLRDGNNNYYTQSDRTELTDPTNATAVTDTMKLKIYNPNKWDIGKAGYIELTDPTTGAVITCQYDSGDTANVNARYDGLDDPPNDPYVEITVTRPNGCSINTFKALAGAAEPDGGDDALSVSIGHSTNFKGIPHYVDKLNNLVRNLTRAVNEGEYADGTKINGVIGHIDGFDAYGNQGNQFFSYEIPVGEEESDHFVTADTAPDKGVIKNYWLMNAQNFGMNEKLTQNPKDPNLLAAAQSEPVDESDNRVILSLIEISNDRSLFREGKLSDFILGMSSELGIDVRQAQNFEKNYAEVCTYVDNQRESISGVNLNEEMTMMIKYQQLFQAASKLTNVIDEIYDTCINRLGLAGR